MTTKLIIFLLLISTALGMHLSNKNFIAKKYISEEKPNSKNDTNPIYINNIANTTEMKILNVSGDLYEYKKEQILNIFINLKKNLFKPEEIKNITLFSLNKSRLYAPKTECHYKSYYVNGNGTNIYCYLDLTSIPKGDYLIYYFYYQNKIINDRITLITIKEEKKKETKTEIPQLIDVFAAGFENMSNQNFTLYFKTNDFDYELINGITIFKNNTIGSFGFYISLICLHKERNNSAFCLADFKGLIADKYNIMFLEYNKKYINVTGNISFDVYKKREPIEEDLKLINIYGDAYSNNISLLNLIFNKAVNVSYFSRFFLSNIKQHFSYVDNINFSFYKSSYNSSVYCYFDFRKIPIRTYSLNFNYKNKEYITDVALTVKKKEILVENELLDVYSNFKRNKTNQIAYFSFNGENKNNNLAYIVLKDEYSKINVLQTFDCKIVDYNSISFDLKCNLNLTYVDGGKYTISEYYINNQHYYTKKNINVIVQ